MWTRESWTNRRAQRPDLEDVKPGTVLAFSGPMNAGHRCDRCGARAYVRVLLPSRRELLFCAHHYRQHATALAEEAAEIQDETGRLARTE